MKNFISEETLRAQQSEIVSELEAQLSEQKKMLGSYKKEHGKLELLFSRLEKMVKPSKPLPILYEPSKENKKVDSPCAAVMKCSDWHYGASVVSEEVEGFNVFDLNICENRVKDYTTKVIKWVETKRLGYKIPDLHIIELGDMISGDIHDELRRTNVVTVPEQCIAAGDLFHRMVASIAPYFENVVVHYLVADNHGRLTNKPQANEEGKNHFNYIVGHHAKSLLAKHSNVDFRIYEVHERVIDINNMRYLIMHGHGIPQNFGVPWYGIERQIGRESSARLQKIMTDDDIIQASKDIGFNKLLHGHYHIYFDHNHYSCNGAIEGTTAYDHKYGRHSDPCQTAFMVHPKNGEFDMTHFKL